VSFFPVPKWPVAIFLLLSVAWKLAARSDTDNKPEDGVMAFLTRQGFRTAVSSDMTFPSLVAANDLCRMRIMIASQDGADRDRLRNVLAADERLIFVHHGEVYQEQPILLTVATELLARPLRKMGLTRRDDLVLAVLAQRRCDVERLPWDQLR
jgi:hypothetical protein